MNKEKIIKVLSWLMLGCMAIGLATLLYWGYYFLLTGWKYFLTTK